jgi:hypothetical protein
VNAPAVNPPKTEGLTPLDRDRASSIADEGGTSAATIEAQRRPTPTPDIEDGLDPEETLPLTRRPLENK